VSREGHRWKLLGNAVTVPVAAWLGRRLVSPGDPVDVPRMPLDAETRWPSAAAGVRLERESWSLSERPLRVTPRMSLARTLIEYGAVELSLGAARGFATRLEMSRLRYRPEFLRALQAHIAFRAAG
jgi:DNA (cytosine-5)-methyltransferase 1